MDLITRPLKTVAIADDDDVIRKMLVTIVSDMGYDCVGEAGNGMEAVELIRSKKPDLLLLDFHMPQMDGLEAIREIATLKTTAVVMLTGDTDPAIARKALDLGASGYMQKPFEAGQIAAVLESAWHRFQTVALLEQKTRNLEETLELRKLVEKAKGVLMEQQQYSEEAAHKMLQKMSQDQGVSIKEICRSIIQVRLVLGKASQRNRAA